jgi:hypothetical protein
MDVVPSLLVLRLIWLQKSKKAVDKKRVDNSPPQQHTDSLERRMMSVLHEVVPIQRDFQQSLEILPINPTSEVKSSS